jgi:phosphatidylserine/phosphatidylglycerophosphate/cardiolipin synthase-like enzyme
MTAFLCLWLWAISAVNLPSYGASLHGSSVPVVEHYAATSPPQNLEVCFAPDEPCDIKLIKFVNSAEQSLDVAIFDINLSDLVQALLAKMKKGIAVRIVVDRRQSKGPYSQVPTLVEGGADVRYGAQKGVFHDKFVIVDGAMLETGSFNFTNHAARANQENQVYLSDPKVLRRFSERFEKIWANARIKTLK